MTINEDLSDSADDIENRVADGEVSSETELVRRKDLICKVKITEAFFEGFFKHYPKNNKMLNLAI